jgi:hypothetical protein
VTCTDAFLGRHTVHRRAAGSDPGLTGMARMPDCTLAAANIAGGAIWATAMGVDRLSGRGALTAAPHIAA